MKPRKYRPLRPIAAKIAKSRERLQKMLNRNPSAVLLGRAGAKEHQRLYKRTYVNGKIVEVLRNAPTERDTTEGPSLTETGSGATCNQGAHSESA